MPGLLFDQAHGFRQADPFRLHRSCGHNPSQVTPLTLRMTVAHATARPMLLLHAAEKKVGGPSPGVGGRQTALPHYGD
jgi:hypothetical protein